MKISRYRSFLITVVLLISLVSPQAILAAERHFLWRATADASTVYLLGSVHFMKKDAYPLSPVIEEAFDTCDTLAVEADINNIGPGTLQMLRRAGFYEPRRFARKPYIPANVYICDGRSGTAGISIACAQSSETLVPRNYTVIYGAHAVRLRP